MKNGDIILNVKDRLVVIFKGWIAGEVCTYEIKLDEQQEDFTGTVSELLKHCSDKVEEYNKNCRKAGGTLL